MKNTLTALWWKVRGRLLLKAGQSIGSANYSAKLCWGFFFSISQLSFLALRPQNTLPMTVTLQSIGLHSWVELRVWKRFKLLTQSGILAQEVQQKCGHTWFSNETFSQPTYYLLEVMFFTTFIEWWNPWLLRYWVDNLNSVQRKECVSKQSENCGRAGWI